MLINLTPGFEPFGKGIAFKSFTFPSGIEKHFKIKDWVDKNITFTLRINNMDDLMLLFLATDAVRRTGTVEKIEVFFPYLPYARQDRVMDGVEPFSLKVFAKLINSQNYDKVSFLDAHSDVATALIENSESLSNKALVANTLEQRTYGRPYVICTPDAGAAKKIYKLLQKLSYDGDLIIGNKHRNLANGKIEGFSIDAKDLKGKDVYIIDDICSRGGTFVGIAKQLKAANAGNIYLIVSHLEACVGREKLADAGINKIYTTDSIQYGYDFSYSGCEIKQFNITLHYKY